MHIIKNCNLYDKPWSFLDLAYDSICYISPYPDWCPRLQLYLVASSTCGGPVKNTKKGGCDCAVNGRIKPRTGIVCGERVVCAWNGWCFAENGLLGFPV